MPLEESHLVLDFHENSLAIIYGIQTSYGGLDIYDCKKNLSNSLPPVLSFLRVNWS